jgi:hypothetical protein
MKHLLTGVAVSVALAFSAPVWAQPTTPGGNPMGMPGPNPGGPGLTPYTTSPRPPTPPQYTPPTTTAPQPPSMPDATYSATPPSYPSKRHARTYHGKTGTHPGHGYSSSDSNADQLNQAELARLQAGNYPNPAAPGYASPPPRPPQPGYPMGTTGGGAPYRP